MAMFNKKVDMKKVCTTTAQVSSIVLNTSAAAFMVVVLTNSVIDFVKDFKSVVKTKKPGHTTYAGKTPLSAAT